MMAEKINLEEEFMRFYHEHVRLYAPESIDSAFKLVPAVHTITTSAGKPGRKKELPRKKIRGGIKSISKSESDLQEAGKVGNLFDMHWPDAYEQSHSTSFEEEPIFVGTFAEAAEPEGKPDIEISFEPAGQMPLFEDVHFDLDAPGATKVEILWRTPDNCIQRSVMDHQKADLFSATVGLEDRDWLFGFEVDGDIRPDRRHAQKLSINPEGIFATLNLMRGLRLCNIHNDKNEDETARLSTTVPWIEVPGELFLPARQTVKTPLRLLPRLMTAGSNQGLLQVQVCRKGKEILAATKRVEAIAEPFGAIPDFHYSPTEYGWILQGIDKLELIVEVKAIGIGTLKGMIYLPQQSEVADFGIRVDGAPFQRKFVIDSSTLAHRMEGTLKVNIVTDSYLANHRQFGFELPYKLVYLKKSLPALSFGRVRKGMTQTLRLEVKRSDDKEVDIEVSVPETAAPYLQAFRARADTYSFRFDSRELQSGTKFNEIITLIDRRSGLRDQIKALGEVIANRTHEAIA